MVLDADARRWPDRAESTLKKLNGRGIAATLCSSTRGDEGDRPRDDRADQQLVALARGERGEVEMDVAGRAGGHLASAFRRARGSGVAASAPRWRRHSGPAHRRSLGRRLASSPSRARRSTAPICVVHDGHRLVGIAARSAAMISRMLVDGAVRRMRAAEDGKDQRAARHELRHVALQQRIAAELGEPHVEFAGEPDGDALVAGAARLVLLADSPSSSAPNAGFQRLMTRRTTSRLERPAHLEDIPRLVQRRLRDGRGALAAGRRRGPRPASRASAARTSVRLMPKWRADLVLGQLGARAAAPAR